MEINTEINKIVGDHMAQLFSESITDEELREQARIVFNHLSANGFKSGNKEPSYLERKIAECLTERIDRAVKTVIENTPDSVYEVAAREIIKNAEEIAKSEYTKELAKAMKAPGLSNDAAHMIAGSISAAIHGINYRR